MTSTRRSDRLNSALLRAVAVEPGAELRGGRVVVADRPVPIVVPYLVMSPDESSIERRRGVVDALALRVRHSDPALHDALRPTPLLERVVFDIAEQFRSEANADDALTGVKLNTTAAFDRWSEAAMANRVAETGVGLLVFTITHMLRARLLRRPTGESVDEAIEVTRGNLSKLVGHALKALPGLVDDQEAFAQPAAEIARLVAEMVEDAADDEGDVPEEVTANALLVPIDWDELDELASSGAAGGAGGEGDGPTSDYRVFTTAYDSVVRAERLYREPALRRLRSDLEVHIRDQAVSVTRLARRFVTLFPSWTRDGWDGAREEGALDPSKLARIVTDPTDRLVHRQERERLSADAAVTFLIDTTGSMKAQRYESVAVLVDTMVRALELAGVTTEVLGFTTGTWGGGRPVREWRAAGSPAEPGRLNEVQYLVYKEAERSWRQSRLAMAAMLRTDHYREGVDGEALAWAYQRLLVRNEPRRFLVMISDGAPMDSATANNNRDGFLGDHLGSVADRIEADGRVRLGSIGIDLELDRFIRRSVPLDLDGTLTVGTYDVLHRLFA